MAVKEQEITKRSTPSTTAIASRSCDLCRTSGFICILLLAALRMDLLLQQQRTGPIELQRLRAIL